MYSAFKFNNAKAELAYALLNNPDDRILKIEATFLRHLLSAAAKQGFIADQDIQVAIENSGVFDLNEEAADKMIEYLWNVGDDYVGALSPTQAQELRKLRNLCLRAVERGDADALAQIAELI